MRSAAVETKRGDVGISRDFTGDCLLVCVAHGRGGGASGKLAYHISHTMQIQSQIPAW